MKYLVPLVSFTVMTGFMSGCTLIGLDYARPESGLPVKYSEQGTQATQVSAVELPHDWWTLYQDEELNRLIQKAFNANTDVLAAVAKIEEADAKMREVGASALPTLDLNGNATRTKVTEAGVFPPFGVNPRNNYNLILNAAIEVDVWGKIKRAREWARAGYLSSQYAKSTVMWSLSSLVAGHYLQLRSLDAQMKATRENLTLAEESLALTQRRFDGGVVSNLDVYQASQSVDSFKSQLLELQRMRAMNEHQLQILTGELDLKIAEADVMALPVPPTPPEGLPSSLLESRPDILQAEQQLVAANANVALAKAALYPSISLTGAFGGESVELSNIMKSAARVWSMGLALNLPIFNAGELDAKVDQANAQQKQLVANYQSAIRVAFTEVNDALTNVRIYREQEQLASSRRTTAANMLAIAENRYKEGYSSYLDVLDAQRTHQEATLAFIQSRQNVLIATVDLFKALGSGWEKSQP